MKKILSIALAGIFALSFVAGAFVSQSNAEIVPLCWKAGDCNFETGKVYTCCLLKMGKNGKEVRKCWWDDQYFAQWCPY